MVRVGRLELPASCSQSKRATNCATPGYGIFQLWSNMGSTPVFDPFPARGKTPSALAPQSFPGFWRRATRTPASRSQITCATNCATPGYSVFLHDTTRGRKKQVFRVCGWRCGQARFCGGIFRRGISAASYCPKDFQAFTFWGMDRLSILPKQARYQLRYTRIFHFSVWYHAEKEKVSFSCLWATLWSNPILREFFN